MKVNETLYKVKHKDIEKVGLMFAAAFDSDPVWSKIFEGIGMATRSIFFQGPARYCLRYGQVYSLTDSIEGAITFVPSEYADITILRGFRTGSIKSYLSKEGLKLFGLMFKLNPIFAPLENARKELMKDQKYIYLMTLGVDPGFQGKGIGTKMLKALLEHADNEGLVIYLETATEQNIKFYEKYGFKIMKKVIHPVINVPQWCMVRESR